jgi:cytochrome c peroxidase
MPRAALICFLVPLTVLACSRAAAPGKAEGRASGITYVSPCDFAIVPSGRYLVTANHTADSVSLIDLEEGKVIDTHVCGKRPSAVAVSRDGKRIVVAALWSGTLKLFTLQNGSLDPAGEIAIGALPRGVIFAPDGDSMYAAVSGQDEIVRVDWKTQKVKARWPAPREPRALALSPDGRYLAAASARSGQVRCWDTRDDLLPWERTIDDAFNLRGLVFTPDGEGLVCAHSVRRSFPVTKTNIEEGWVIDNRLTWLALKPDARPAMKQIALDRRGEAAADLHGVAFDENGTRLAVTASGTHELLLLDAAHIPWSAADPGDVLPVKLERGEHALRRASLDGRPMAVAFFDAGHVVVANYLLDAFQVIDVKNAKVARSIALGGSKEQTPARRGEALFYDARRSHDQWFSCSSCHVEGHTCGLNFDTLNDDSYGNPKLTPSLRGVSRTGPWTWHGWQKDLGAGVEKSFAETMFGPRPTSEETKAIVAFLETLDHPPNPRAELNDAAKRGKALFSGKARCSKCHFGDDYTSSKNYDVKLEPDGSPYKLWNPPSLRGVWDRGPYLHDGRAKSLTELLQKHHAPENLSGEALTKEEQNDLVAFLKSL